MTPRPARDAVEVMEEIERLASNATRKLDAGDLVNGRTALVQVRALAADHIRHVREDAAAAASRPRLALVDERGATAPVALPDMSGRQNAVAEAIAEKWGRSAITRHGNGSVTVHGMLDDVVMELVTIDQDGLDDNGGDILVRLQMARERRLRELLSAPHGDAMFAHEEVHGDGCEECGGWPPAGGCDACGATMVPTGSVA